MSVTVEGDLPDGVTAKDIVLAIIGHIGTGGGIGHVIEYRGEAITDAVDGRSHDRLQHVDRSRRPRRPDRARRRPPSSTSKAATTPHRADWDAAVADWRTLRTDDGAVWDKEVVIDASITPTAGHVGHQPRPGRLDRRRPCRRPTTSPTPTTRETVARALEYMGLTPGTPIRDIAVDTVFIGSCTNSRIEDLRAAAAVMRGRQVTVPRVMVVPGSHRVKAQAEAEGLHEIFRAAGADWREPAARCAWR